MIQNFLRFKLLHLTNSNDLNKNLVTLDSPAIPWREVDRLEPSAVKGYDRFELVVRRFLKVVRRNVILEDFFPTSVSSMITQNQCRNKYQSFNKIAKNIFFPSNFAKNNSAQFSL
jgi:hypothetical protein